MLKSDITIDELGSGRVRLPATFVEANRLSYGQPILVTCQENGVPLKFLCTASAAVRPGQAGCSSFDPSLQCGLHTGPLSFNQGSSIVASVTPITGKPVTAATVKVLAPATLQHSPLPAARLQQRLIYNNCTLHLAPSVSVHVLEVTAATPTFSLSAAAAVYRVVPSTIIQLVTADSGTNNSEASQTPPPPPSQPRSAAAAAQSPAAVPSNSSSQDNSSKGSSSQSRSKTSSRRAKSTSTATDSGSDRPSCSSSSSSKSRKKSGQSSKGAAIAASASKFHILDALGEDD